MVNNEWRTTTSLANQAGVAAALISTPNALTKSRSSFGGPPGGCATSRRSTLALGTSGAPARLGDHRSPRRGTLSRRARDGSSLHGVLRLLSRHVVRSRQQRSAARAVSRFEEVVDQLVRRAHQPERDAHDQRDRRRRNARLERLPIAATRRAAPTVTRNPPGGGARATTQRARGEWAADKALQSAVGHGETALSRPSCSRASSWRRRRRRHRLRDGGRAAAARLSLSCPLPALLSRAPPAIFSPPSSRVAPSRPLVVARPLSRRPGRFLGTSPAPALFGLDRRRDALLPPFLYPGDPNYSSPFNHLEMYEQCRSALPRG